MQNEHLLLSSAAAEERQLVAGSKCVLELAFATSLKQLMLCWSHVEKDRLIPGPDSVTRPGKPELPA